VRVELALASPAQACKSADGAPPLQLLRSSGVAHNRTSAEVDAGGSSGSGGGGGGGSEGLAVLVDRGGGCSFGEKVEVAAAAGASVVLVGNTREGELKSAAKQARGRGVLGLLDLTAGSGPAIAAPLTAAAAALPVLALSSASAHALRELHAAAVAAAASGGVTEAQVPSIAVCYEPQWRERAHSQAGLALGARKRFKAAAAEFRRARKLAPDFAQHATNHGAALLVLIREAAGGTPRRQPPAQLLAATEEALAAAVALNPADSSAVFNMAQLFVEQGRLAKAVEELKRAYALTYSTSANLSAEHTAALRKRSVKSLSSVLMQQGHKPLSKAWTAATFDMYAGWFDESMSELEYKGVHELGAALRAVLGRGAALDDQGQHVLDVGCGTGKMGALLRKGGRVAVVGCDVSSGMVALARKAGDYERVLVRDGVELLNEWAEGRAGPPAALDVVTVADALIYIGDPAPLLRAASAAMRKLGPSRPDQPQLVALTTESRTPTAAAELREGSADSMWRDGRDRWIHADAYIRAAAQSGGFSVVLERQVELRKHKGKYLQGTIFVLELQLNKP
jgi:predicted TPR repeat methyltransferase